MSTELNSLTIAGALEGLAKKDFSATELTHAHLKAMEAHSRATGDPLAAALAQFDRTLLYEIVGVPERGEEAAEQLLDLAAQRSNPSLRSMALLSHARVVAQLEGRFPDVVDRLNDLYALPDALGLDGR